MNFLAMIGGILLALTVAQAEEFIPPLMWPGQLAIGPSSNTVAIKAPPISFILSAGPSSMTTIKPDGNVVLSEGLTLDEASIVFWKRIQEVGLKLSCEQK